MVVRISFGGIAAVIDVSGPFLDGTTDIEGCTSSAGNFIYSTTRPDHGAIAAYGLENGGGLTRLNAIILPSRLASESVARPSAQISLGGAGEHSGASGHRNDALIGRRGNDV